MYHINELARYISLNNVPASWNNCYNDIKIVYNSNWLDKYNFDEILNYYEFDSEFKERFYKEITLLKQDNKLNIICFIMYYILFFADTKNYNDIWSWKSKEEVFKFNGSYMIPVVSLLCGYEVHIKNMKLRNFDEEQIKLQKYNIKLTCINDRIRYNVDGILFTQMIWGSIFMKGKLIQVGRLQYEIDVKNFSKLDKYFKEKHKYIYIHIPRDNDLTEEDVNESFSLANEYIKRYYPELKNEKLAYYTESWLLSPEVKEILPINSNIMKFQNKFNIIEYQENVIDFLYFVFDEIMEDVNYNNLQERTTLQRALKIKLLNDEKLHLGLGFLK